MKKVLVAVVVVLMYIAEFVDEAYTKRIYRHKKLPHGWEQ